MATNNINTQIQKLIDKTVEGKIDWKIVSNNQLRWTQKNGDRLYITIISKLAHPPMQGKYEYAFMIQAMSPNEIIMQVQTDFQSKEDDILATLFEIASNSSKDNAANIIDTLLESV